MTCSACSSRVEGCVVKLPGVKDVSVNLLKNSMMVSYDEAQLSTAGIVEAVEKTGYGAIPKDAPQRKAEAKAEISTAQAEYKAIKQQAKIPERHRPAGRLSAAQPLIRLPPGENSPGGFSV